MYRNIGRVSKGVEDTVDAMDQAIIPVRRSIFKRFPVTFTLLVTFGVSATFFGIERIIMDISWLNDRPVVILILGLMILILTGSLYKKLG
ncbi:MAG: hypothetical protein K9M10_03615 [Candidatus Pacebacteria bacterium]|nr:hypothetical protein [Candidatus Paceibacterota bacterium]MCF7857539.1 hypothetical protein [Candidatus Paceibacterota bacterium]